MREKSSSGVQGGSHESKDASMGMGADVSLSIPVGVLAEAVASSPLQTAPEFLRNWGMRGDVYTRWGSPSSREIQYAEEASEAYVAYVAASKTAEILKERDALREELMREKKRVCIGGDVFETGRNELILHQQTELDYLQRAEKAESELQSAQQQVNDLTDYQTHIETEITHHFGHLVSIGKVLGELESAQQTIRDLNKQLDEVKFQRAAAEVLAHGVFDLDGNQTMPSRADIESRLRDMMRHL